MYRESFRSAADDRLRTLQLQINAGHDADRLRGVGKFHSVTLGKSEKPAIDARNDGAIAVTLVIPGDGLRTLDYYPAETPKPDYTGQVHDGRWEGGGQRVELTLLFGADASAKQIRTELAAAEHHLRTTADQLNTEAEQHNVQVEQLVEKEVARREATAAHIEQLRKEP